MKKVTALLMASILFLFSVSCAKNLTEEEKEEYRKANRHFRMTQGGP
jgi:hypothetical protein